MFTLCQISAKGSNISDIPLVTYILANNSLSFRKTNRLSISQLFYFQMVISIVNFLMITASPMKIVKSLKKTLLLLPSERCTRMVFKRADVIYFSISD